MEIINTGWSLVPALVAIVLALITKEVYSSLFIGILFGGLLYSGFNLVATMEHVFVDGMIGSLADSWNAGILIFLVILGAMVQMMNRAGGSAAFGRWAAANVKSKVGAQIATIFLGMLIFIDDYFNCLTVGSVMRPVTDKHGISREKLAYLIDATAAPVCIIAPISSWAAAVTSSVDGLNGLDLFIKAIPYNFYALLTILMMFVLAIGKFDFGPMDLAEAAQRVQHKSEGHLPGEATIGSTQNEVEDNPKGKVIHLILPIIVLIICCVIGMIYTGDFFGGEIEGNIFQKFITAFSDSDASVGLAYGSFGGIIFTVLLYLIRRVLSFKDCMSCVEEGFKAMVPPISILTLAWSLKAMTDSLGAAEYVANIVDSSKGSFINILPAVIFLIACGLAFATGTSWGTFGILIPITLKAFPLDGSSPLAIICVSACMAGAVCGDHCSPISDTTIMSSAGAQCNHIAHVSTQLPYALTAAAVSFVTYLIAGFVTNAAVSLLIGVVLMVGMVLLLRYVLPTPESSSLKKKTPTPEKE